jgi:hypothetical protein
VLVHILALSKRVHNERRFLAMKKLKKGLSLLLVFAMIFSFASTAFAASTDWTDYSADTAKTDAAYEAVQVMTGLGIIDGVSDNTLKPDGNFTRAQAAKVITYMLLGTKAGEALGDKTVAESERKFSDYTYNTQWAIPYVEYCAGRGIIEGYEDGNFYPNRLVTSTEWLKMLVCALGYDASAFTGKDWATRTYDAAISYHIITAEEFALDFDRETAILYAYNALISEFPAGLNQHSLAVRVFDLKAATYTYDSYGAPTSKVIKAGTTTVATIAIEPTSTLPDNSTFVMGTNDKGLTAVTYVEDGQEVDYEAGTKMGGNSSAIAIYEKYDGTRTRVVVVNTQVAKLTAGDVKDYDKVDTKETLKVGDIVIWTQGNTDGENLPTAEANKKIVTAERVTAVPGKVSDIDRTNKWVNVDGVKKVSAKNCNYKDIAVLATNVKYNFYYDNYGNIIYIDTYTEPTREGTLVFLLNSVYDSVYDTSDVWVPTTDDTYQAKYIDLSSATIETVDVNAIDGQTPLKATDTSLHTYKTVTYNRYYLAYENEDGTVDLKPYQDAAAGNKNVTYGKATINEADPKVLLSGAVTSATADDASWQREFVADSNTKLTVITYTGNKFENLQITTTTGYANFKDASYTSGYTYTTAVSIDTAKTPSDIYVIAPLAAPATTTAYMMYTGEGVDHAEGGQDYYFVDSNGVKQTLTFDVTNPAVTNNYSDGVYPPLVAGTVYKLTLDKENVFIDAVAQKPADGLSGEVVKTDKAGYLSIGTLANLAQYNDFCGRVPVKTADGSTFEITPKGVDKNGCDVAGTKVSLYTNDEGEIVFITDYTAAK